MNTILWIIQVILCIKVLTSAYKHGLRRNQPAMCEAILRMGTRSQAVLSLTSVGMLIAGLGLVLPAVQPGVDWIAAVAAALLAGMLLISIPLHRISREKPATVVSVVLFVLAAFVAVERWS